MNITKMILSITILILIGGCSLVSVGGGDTYRRDIGRLPQEKPLSLESIGSVSIAATSINKVLSRIYYEGVEAKDKVTKTALDFSYRVMGFLGVGWEDIDLEDPEAVKKFYDKLGNSLKEKEAQILDLKKQVSDHRTKAAESEKWAKTHEKEALTWKDRVKKFLYSVLGLIIAFLVVSAIVWKVTGLNLIKMAMGGLLWLWKASKETIQGVQEYREKLKKDAAEGDEDAKRRLAELDATLDKHHSAPTKKHVDKIRNGGG